MAVTLSEKEFSLLLKVLGILSNSFTDLEIKDSTICNRSDDRTISYYLDLPFSDSLSLSIIDITSFIKIMKTFMSMGVEIEETNDMYVFKFDNDMNIVINKPIHSNNPYNKDKIDTVLNMISLENLNVSGSFINKLRSISSSFKSDIVIDLQNGIISTQSTDKNTKFTKSIDTVGKDICFKILQSAFPPIDFSDDATLSYGVLSMNNIENIFYKISTTINLMDHEIPFTIYGISEKIDPTSLDI